MSEHLGESESTIPIYITVCLLNGVNFSMEDFAPGCFRRASLFKEANKKSQFFFPFSTYGEKMMYRS